jgi:hypothetical protein
MELAIIALCFIGGPTIYFWCKLFFRRRGYFKD